MIIFLLTVVLGLVFGSFINVLVYRIPRGLSFVRGWSKCPKCKKQIAWFDNIPLLSFILLHGKCRRCGKAISWRYPAVELATGVVFVLTAGRVLGDDLTNWSNLTNLINLSNWYYLFWVWGISVTLIVIFLIDLEFQIIPDGLVLTGLALGGLGLLGSFGGLGGGGGLTTINKVLSAVGASGFLGLIFVITKGKGMGLGDVKFALPMGLILGFSGIVVAGYIAFLTGAVAGSIMILGKKAKLGSKIAFGPFLCLATFVSLLWGKDIWQGVIQLLS